MDTKESAYGTITLSGLNYDSTTVTAIDLSSLTGQDTISITDSTFTGLPGAQSNVSGMQGPYVYTLDNTYLDNTYTVGTNNLGIKSGELQLNGEHADLVINGKSLNATLELIQERLGMLVPNPDMEAEWDELRELAQRYRELEAKCKEKEQIWKKLKQMPPPPLP